MRLNVSGADGSVKGLEWLADTLIELPSPGAAPGCVRAAIQHIIYEQLLQAVFPTPAINGGSSAEGGGSVRAAAEPPTAPRGAGGSGGGAASDDKDSRITIPFVFQ